MDCRTLMWQCDLNKQLISIDVQKSRKFYWKPEWIPCVHKLIWGRTHYTQEPGKKFSLHLNLAFKLSLKFCTQIFDLILWNIDKRIVTRVSPKHGSRAKKFSEMLLYRRTKFHVQRKWENEERNMLDCIWKSEERVLTLIFLNRRSEKTPQYAHVIQNDVITESLHHSVSKLACWSMLGKSSCHNRAKLPGFHWFFESMCNFSRIFINTAEALLPHGCTCLNRKERLVVDFNQQ